MSSRFELWTAVPWSAEPGDRERGLRRHLEDFSLFSVTSPLQSRQVLVGRRIRLDPEGGLHALPDVSPRRREVLEIAHFNAGGRLVGKTTYPAAEEERYVVDFQAAASGDVWLLEELRGGEKPRRILRRLAPDGEQLWAREVEGSVSGLLPGGPGWLQLADAEASRVTRVDADSGEPAEPRVLEAEGVIQEIFANRAGDLLAVVFVPGADRYGLATFGPGGGAGETAVGGVDVYGLLKFPIGVDDGLDLYASRLPSVFGIPGPVHIGRDSRIRTGLDFQEVLVRRDGGAIVACHRHGEELVVSETAGDGTLRRRVVHLPEACRARGENGIDLIHVDGRGRFWLHVGETAGDPGELFVLDDAGRLVERREPPFDLLAVQSTLQLPYTWKVDGAGRLYLPINDPWGFKVVRCSLPRRASSEMAAS